MKAIPMNQQPRSTLKYFLLATFLSVALIGCSNENKPPQSTADIKAGKAIVDKECKACHGLDGKGAAPGIPNLAGQRERYLLTALNEYRDGTRVHAALRSISTNLSDTDRKNVAGYFASLPPIPPKKTAAFLPYENGKQMAKACAGCHGENGNSKIAGTPNLAGQQPRYFYDATQEYMAGLRQAAPMNPLLHRLSRLNIESAALYYASRDRRHEHPARHLAGFTGILQADAYSGYNGLYDPSRLPGAITPALCWSHARRQFFELADIAANVRRGKNAAAISPIALEAVKRIDALFDIERGINGMNADERLRVRREQSAPLLAALEAWLRDERSRLSRSASVAKPIDYMLKRWDWFARFIDDGRICLTNNAAERALRGFALGRKSWLFAGSERGADRAAAMTTLIMTAKLNDIDPLAWLADVLARIAEMPQTRLAELLPWNWKPASLQVAA